MNVEVGDILFFEAEGVSGEVTNIIDDVVAVARCEDGLWRTVGLDILEPVTRH